MGGLDWALLVGASLTFGCSFLFMDIALDYVSPATVTAARIGFGWLVLGLIPVARKPIARADWGRVAVVGLTWFALPLTLFPLAQQYVSSSLAAMINGGTPLMVAVISVLAGAARPGWVRVTGLLMGFGGIAMSTSGPIADGSNLALGVAMCVGAITCYGVAFNIVGPLQRRYGALPVLWRAQTVALVLTLPLAVISDNPAAPSVGAVVALVALGVGGTGLAYFCVAILSGRVGPTRAAVVTYLATPVAVGLGVAVRHDVLSAIQLVGGATTLAGAWLTTNATTARRAQ